MILFLPFIFPPDPLFFSSPDASLIIISFFLPSPAPQYVNIPCDSPSHIQGVSVAPRPKMDERTEQRISVRSSSTSTPLVSVNFHPRRCSTFRGVKVSPSCSRSCQSICSVEQPDIDDPETDDPKNERTTKVERTTRRSNYQ
jgi:hypothetical protein